VSRRPRIVGFLFGDEWRELVEPDGEPTARQLLALNAAGCLELVWPGRAEPITKGEAAWAIANVKQETDADEHDEVDA
jgi:hypothetical protein